MNTNIFKNDTEDYKTLDERPISNGVSNIENVVMARVHRIHTIRKYINRTTLKMYGFVALFAVLVSMVSITNIYANMPSLLTPFDAVAYIFKALTATESAVQVLVVVLGLVAFLAIQDIRKNLREHKILFPQM